MMLKNIISDIMPGGFRRYVDRFFKTNGFADLEEAMTEYKKQVKNEKQINFIRIYGIVHTINLIKQFIKVNKIYPLPFNPNKLLDEKLAREFDEYIINALCVYEIFRRADRSEWNEIIKCEEIMQYFKYD